jgi:hypothetical protein
MAGDVTNAEVKAYAAGYSAAMRILEDLLKRWSESKEPHAFCTCHYCGKLREIVQKDSIEKNIKPGDA